MDERLEKALEISNYMATFDNQKRLLKEQYKENLVLHYKGGQFSITRELISFCQSLLSLEQESTILIDDNDIPVDCHDLQEFTNAILNNYQSYSNRFLTDYNKLMQERSVESIMNL
tara:strand:- start:305 stop:652 length:348 start_codon:yes stop_codon:yes gene_type:complete